MKRLRDMSPEYLRLMVWLQQREIQIRSRTVEYSHSVDVDRCEHVADSRKSGLLSESGESLSSGGEK